MERKLSKKIETHQIEFKNAIKTFIEKYIENDENINPGDLLKFVFDYESINLTKEDFQKRKRLKNTVPQFDRCTACRANGEQCTRRKKQDSCFCGTHAKGTPHGVVDKDNETENSTLKKVEVWIQEIKGINYYIDANNNVYMPDDIVSGKQQPRKIGKWELNEGGDYIIPQLDDYLN